MARKPSTSVVTNIDMLNYMGFVPITFGDKIRLFVSIFGLSTACISYALKLIFDGHEMRTLDFIETSHWLSVYLTVLFYSLQTFYKQDLAIEMDNTLKNGFFKYDYVSHEQQKCLSNANQEIIKATKIFYVLYASAPCLTYVNSFFTGGYKDWEPLYPTYIPFEINSLTRYIIVVLFQTFVSLNIARSALPHVCVLHALHIHICAQLEILSIAIKDMLPPMASESHKKLRLKECVQHHIAIMKFFKTYQNFITFSSVSFAATSSIMLCTIGYLLTVIYKYIFFSNIELVHENKNNGNIVAVIAFMVVSTAEMMITTLYCWYGQKIYDLSQNVGNVVYNIDWKSQNTSFIKDLQMIIIASKKPLQLKGAGLLKFNRETLLDIFKNAYTFLNLLNAKT